MTITGDAINDLIRANVPAAMHGMIPPPCLLDMQGEFLEYEDGMRMSLRFPVLPRYRNPMGNMQGGFIVAALDNTLGPFSYLIAPPSVTATLNTQYLRPVSPDLTHIVCEARLVARTRNVLHLAAEARSEDGRVFVLCQATQQILPPRTT
ncbi:hypothetical protein AO715_12640 [Xanthomonas sp. Mitacek01]|nr:hypothetical protein AO715_12640 [Xanthomonas sp. Mitacek01]